jgi:hypothetical protein
MASAFAPDLAGRALTVFDPLCGRGTTLNQALMYGYHAAGIDTDQRDFEAYSTFIRTWLKRKRIKHHISFDGPVRRDGKVIGRRLRLTMAASKDEQKADLLTAAVPVWARLLRPGGLPASQRRNGEPYRRSAHNRSVTAVTSVATGDVALWASGGRGAHDAFGVLFDRHAKAVYNFLLHRTADSSLAEDLTAAVRPRPAESARTF